MSDQWLSRSSMNVPRNRVGVGVIDNKIYALGGSQGTVHHNSVERYVSFAFCFREALRFTSLATI